VTATGAAAARANGYLASGPEAFRNLNAQPPYGPAETQIVLIVNIFLIVG
jgi:hypothetical protein